jgi:hypothetical protein
MSAKSTEVVPEFRGVIGLSNLGLLAGLIGKAFKSDDASVTVKVENRQGKDTPVAFYFENSSTGATATYRLMGEKAIPNQPKFAGTTWVVQIDEPKRSKINEFAELAGLYSGQETKFRPEIVDQDLIFALGDEGSASHSATVTFATGVSGYKGGYSWPIDQVLAVLKLADNSNTSMFLSNDGILKITVDTGLAVYEYLFPGHY